MVPWCEAKYTHTDNIGLIVCETDHAFSVAVVVVFFELAVAFVDLAGSISIFDGAVKHIDFCVLIIGLFQSFCLLLTSLKCSSL